MLIGKVTKLNGTSVPFKRPPGKGDDNDLPREPRNADPLHDRAALIGDPRNDENLIIAQLHLAFLKAHNRLVDQGRTFEEARRLLRQHYQHIVLHDFLKRVADPAIVDAIITDGNRFYDAMGEPFFLPLEFTVAAFRFGHTMIRDTYDFNLNFPDATLGLLFTFTALSGELGDFDTLPDNWIIQWERFIAAGGGRNKARKFDTKLVRRPVPAPDGHRRDPSSRPDAANLAVRNLLRGYGLRMPTGQAMANRLGLPVLTAAQLEAAAASDTPGRRAQDLRVPGADAALVLPAGRGQAPRRPAPRPGRQHPRRRGAGRPGPAQRRLHPGLARLGAVAALGHAGQVRAGRPAAVRQGRRGRGRAQDLQGQDGRHPVRHRQEQARRRQALAGAVRAQPGQDPPPRPAHRRPGPDPAGPAPMQPEPQLYKVKRGDTLSGIAKKPSWATPTAGRRSTSSTATWSPTRTTSAPAWSW